jgi:hypothetical protein
VQGGFFMNSESVLTVCVVEAVISWRLLIFVKFCVIFEHAEEKIHQF